MKPLVRQPAAARTRVVYCTVYGVYRFGRALMQRLTALDKLQLENGNVPGPAPRLRAERARSVFVMLQTVPRDETTDDVMIGDPPRCRHATHASTDGILLRSLLLPEILHARESMSNWLFQTAAADKDRNPRGL